MLSKNVCFSCQRPIVLTANTRHAIHRCPNQDLHLVLLVLQFLVHQLVEFLLEVLDAARRLEHVEEAAARAEAFAEAEEVCARLGRR